MRRVFDDTYYPMLSMRIANIINNLNPKTLTQYDYGTDRVQVSLVRDEIMRNVGSMAKLGKNEHAHGIGNNNAYELIYITPREEQICGLLHLTDDMFGGVYVWVSDIDGNRKTATRHLR